MPRLLTWVVIIAFGAGALSQNPKRGAIVWTGEVSTIWHDFAQLGGQTCVPMKRDTIQNKGPTPLYTNNWGNTACDPLIPSFPGIFDLVVIGDFLVELLEDAEIDKFDTGPNALLLIEGSGTGTSLTTNETIDANNHDGTIFINPNRFGTASLDFNSLSAILNGSGYVILDHSGSGAQINGSATGTLTLATTMRVLGYGQINANVSNMGHVVADVSGQTLELNPLPLGFTNYGVVAVREDAVLLLSDGSLFSQTLIGRTVVDGQFNLTTGTLNLAAGALIGSGSIGGDLEHSTAVSPGHPVGELQIGGSYTSVGGTLVIEIGGLSQHDVLTVSGTADLSGNLLIVPVNGFIPQPGQSFTIVTAGSISQMVTQVVSSGEFTESYAGNQLTLTVTTAPNTPDLNQDSIANILDMIQVTNAIVIPSRVDAEDMNGDGAVGLDDILLVGVNWTSGVMAP